MRDKSSKNKKPASIAALRSKIDRLDRDILRLANERGKLAIEVGRVKTTEGRDSYSPGREDEVLSSLVEHNPGPLHAEAIRALFRELISGSRALEKERSLSVAFLGPAYTFSHLAAMEKFGQSVEYVPVGSIAAVFEEIHRGHVEFGLVPIENSTDGRVADTLDLFTRMPLRIGAEVWMRIHHHLLAMCSRGDIIEVYSRPQALSQCRNWLTRNLPQARVIEVTSTATAAQLARDKPGAAAVASLQAAAHYGLTVVAENVEDNSGNYTRFAVIGQQAAERTGRDKTAIMFHIPHRPGSLADSLMVFKRNRINLTWIESFPLRGPEPGYLFFLDFEGHELDCRVRRALAALERKTERLEILGSFPASEPIG